MLITGGTLIEGTLDKKTLGASEGSLIHIIWMEEGPDAARAFLSQTQYLVNYWLLQHGFSIGIGDTVADPDTMQDISHTIQQVRKRPKSPVRQHADWPDEIVWLYGIWTSGSGIVWLYGIWTSGSGIVCCQLSISRLACWIVG